jgi:hypothetical protein
MYGVWLNMKERCYNPKHRYFMHYGGKGVVVCDEWRDDFRLFYEWAISNGYADNLTIDRIDCGGNYCPENCRWITIQEQQNHKSNSLLVEFDGKVLNLKQLSKLCGVHYDTMFARYKKGVRGDKLIAKPKERTYGGTKNAK